jgi:hypothetical protein
LRQIAFRKSPFRHYTFKRDRLQYAGEGVGCSSRRSEEFQRAAARLIGRFPSIAARRAAASTADYRRARKLRLVASRLQKPSVSAGVLTVRAPSEGRQLKTLLAISKAQDRGTPMVCRRPLFAGALPAFRRRCRWTSSANGAFGRHERHDSAGMRLVTAASR